MHASVLVAGAVALDHIPVEQREDLVEARIAVQVGVVEIREAAVAEANVGRRQRQARLRVVRYAGALHIDEAARVDVSLPLVHTDLAHVAGIAHSARTRAGCRVRPTRSGHAALPPNVIGAAHGHGLRDPVDDLIVPLVEGRDLPVARRDTLEIKVAVAVALRERDFSTVRVAQADVALRERQ